MKFLRNKIFFPSSFFLIRLFSKLFEVLTFYRSIHFDLLHPLRILYGHYTTTISLFSFFPLRRPSLRRWPHSLVISKRIANHLNLFVRVLSIIQTVLLFRFHSVIILLILGLPVLNSHLYHPAILRKNMLKKNISSINYSEHCQSEGSRLLNALNGDKKCVRQKINLTAKCLKMYEHLSHAISIAVIAVIVCL